MWRLVTALSPETLHRICVLHSPATRKVASGSNENVFLQHRPFQSTSPGNLTTKNRHPRHRRHGTQWPVSSRRNAGQQGQALPPPQPRTSAVSANPSSVADQDQVSCREIFQSTFDCPTSQPCTLGEIRPVRNFSCHNLTENQHEILQLGLNAVVVHKPPMPSTSSIRLEYLHNRCCNIRTAGPSTLRFNSHLTTFLGHRLPLAIRAAARNHHPSGRFLSHSNISPQQLAGLKQLVGLTRSGNVVIVPADKESAVVLMNGTDHIKEGVRLLSNAVNYVPIAKPLHPSNFKKTCSILDELLERGAITNAEYLGALPGPDYRWRTLRLLPKTHKPSGVWIDGKPPCRPIVPNHFTETAGKILLYQCAVVNQINNSYCSVTYDRRASLLFNQQEHPN